MVDSVIRTVVPEGAHADALRAAEQRVADEAYRLGAEARISYDDGSVVQVEVDGDGLGDATIIAIRRNLEEVLRAALDLADGAAPVTPATPDPTVILESANQLVLIEMVKPDEDICSFVREQARDLGVRVDFKRRDDLVPGHGAVWQGALEVIVAGGGLVGAGAAGALGAEAAKDVYSSLKSRILRWKKANNKVGVSIAGSTRCFWLPSLSATQGLVDAEQRIGEYREFAQFWLNSMWGLGTPYVVANSVDEARSYDEFNDFEVVTPGPESDDAKRGPTLCLYPNSPAVLLKAAEVSSGSALLVVGGLSMALDDWIEENAASPITELKAHERFRRWRSR